MSGLSGRALPMLVTSLVAAVAVTAAAGTALAAPASPATRAPAAPGRPPVVAPSPAAGARPDPATGAAAGSPAAAARPAVPAGFSQVSSTVLPDLTTPTRLVYGNPDGSRTLQLSTRPVRYRDAAGAWQSDDFTLGEDGHGGKKARSAPPGTAALTGSAVGSVATLGTPAGPVALAHPDAVAPAGPALLAGPTATFTAVLGGRDLAVSVGLGALEESVVLPSRSLLATLPGANSYLATLTVPAGVTARAGGNGVQLLDASGALVGAYGGGYATDSAVTGSGQGAAAPVVSTLLGQAGPVVTVQVAVDGGWLADPARVFPVTIDPSLSANTSAESGASYDTYTYSPFPTTPEGTFDTSPVLKVGTFDGGASVSRSYLNFDLTGLAGTVSEAHVTVNNFYSFSCSTTPPALTLSGLASAFSRSGTTWNNQPAPDGAAVSNATFSYGYSSACPGRNVDLDATALAGRWAAGAANNGIVLFTNEANSFGWKKFTSGAAGAATAPTLSITYSTDCTFYPQTGFSVCGAIRDHYNALGGPGGLLGYPTANELLSPDGVGKRQYFQHGYIYWSPSTGAFEIAGPIFTRWAAQGWELGPLGYPVTDERAATTSFNGTGDRQNDFQHGSIYLNHLNGVTNNQTNPALLVGDKPFFSYDTINLTDRLTAKVNRGTGNLGLSLTALTVPGVAADRPVGLTYSALSQAPGSSVQGSGVTDVHGGWRVRDNPDIRIGPGPGYADYLDSSFAVWRFVGNGPTYTAPAGLDADLTRNPDNTYRLKVHASAQTLTFDAQGTLTGDADRNNNLVSFPANAFATAITGSRGGGGGRTAVVSYNRPGGRIGELCQSTTASNCTGSATRGPATLVVDYTYSAAGNLTGVTDANGHDTTFGYDTTNSDPGMQQNLTSVTDPTGVVTRFTYDSIHRVTGVTRDASGRPATTTYDYITADQHTRVYDANHARPSGVYVDDGVDTTGKITDRTDQMGHHSSTTWTADNQVQTSTNASGGTSTNNYIQPVNAPAGQNGPESLNGNTGPMGAKGTATYTNSAGSNALYAPTTTTDSMKNQSTYSYDGPGNLGSATNANAAAALVNHNIAGAFTDGTVSTTTDPNNVGANPARNTVYNYDPANTHNLISITPPAGDNTLAARSFSYDGFGRTRTRTTGKLTTTYGYDRLGRVTSATHSDGSPALSVSYDNDGNPTVSTDGTGTVTNTYTGLNQLASAVRTGTSPSTISYTYDLTGALTGLTDGGGSTGYRYNKAGELDQVDEVGGGQSLFAYNADHKRTDTWHNTTGTNGTVATYDATGNTLLAPAGFAVHTTSTLDRGNRLTKVKTTRASSDSTVAADISYCYSPLVAGQPCPPSSTGTDTDKRQYTTDGVTGATTVNSYDTSGRLTRAASTGGSVPPKTYSYCYDADGNRSYEATTAVDCTQVGAGKPIPPTHTYNSVNQLTSGGAGYDTDGNQTAPAPLTAGSYNTADQSVSFTPAGKNPISASYAGQGQSVRLTLDGTSFTTGLPGLTSETTSSASTYYERDPNGTLLARRTVTAATTNQYYYYLDGLGSVLGLINKSGGVAVTYTYDPYGNTTSTGGPNTALAASNAFRYASGYLDTATGLYKYGARYYQPTLGRWTQQDTLNIIGDPANGNRYTYTGDDPINNIDPTGRFLGIGDPFGCAFAIAGLVGSEVSLIASIAAVPPTAGIATPLVVVSGGFTVAAVAGAAYSCGT